MVLHSSSSTQQDSRRNEPEVLGDKSRMRNFPRFLISQYLKVSTRPPFYHKALYAYRGQKDIEKREWERGERNQ